MASDLPMARHLSRDVVDYALGRINAAREMPRRRSCVVRGVGLAAEQGTGQVQAIRAALGARDFGLAVERSRSALQASPRERSCGRCRALHSPGKATPEALPAFNQALKLSPDYVAALEGAAQLHYEAGSREAVPLLNRLLRLRPGEPTSHAMLAVFEYRDGNCQAAVGHFEKAGALLDSELDALHAHGTCLVRLKQPDAATRVFQRTVALRPDDARERRLLAAIQLMAEKPQDALQTLEPLIGPPARCSDARTRVQRLRGSR